MKQVIASMFTAILRVRAENNPILGMSQVNGIPTKMSCLDAVQLQSVCGATDNLPKGSW